MNVFYSEEYSFEIDTIYPVIEIKYPVSELYNHQIISFNSTLQEVNPDKCWYNLGLVNTFLHVIQI